jgi:hypothetical protein
MKINWGTAIVIFFAIFISLAIAFVIFALRQNNDLVADDYYEQGAHFSQSIEIKKRSIPYKDSIQITQSDSAILLDIYQSIAQKADSFSVHFYCSSQKKNDISFSVKAINDSLRSAPKSMLVFPAKDFTKSFYSVKIAWWIDNLQFEVDKDLFIK